MSRYSICIMTSGQFGLRGVSSSCVAIQHSHGCDTTSCRLAIRPGARDTERRYDRLGLRHGRPQGCDTAGARPRHGPASVLSALRATWVHHARSQGRVCTHYVLDLGLDSVHCF